MAVINLVKVSPDCFMPATVEDKEKMTRIKSHEWIQCEYKTVRNYEFHKRFFALLNLGFEYWTPTGGTIQEAEKEFLDGYVRFVASYADHLTTLEEFAVAYTERTARRRAVATDANKSREAFRHWVTIEAGFYDFYVFPDGTERREPKSISFANMSQESFIELYRAVFNVLWGSVLRHTFKSYDEAERVAWRLLEFS